MALAPLLCAGLIGWRSLVKAGDGKASRAVRLRCRGAYRHAGGALAGRDVYAFSRRAMWRRRTSPVRWARSGPVIRASCRRCRWMRRSSMRRQASWCRPRCALCARVAGGCAGIHMSDIPSFPTTSSGQEREVVSVANLTPGRPGVLSGGRRSASIPKPTPTRWSRPIRRWMTCATGVSGVLRCWCPNARCARAQSLAWCGERQRSDWRWRSHLRQPMPNEGARHERHREQAPGRRDSRASARAGYPVVYRVTDAEATAATSPTKSKLQLAVSISDRQQRSSSVGP